ncbi:MAG: biotin/lipoyl-binding protein [Candidatus Thiodiazotropha sp.]
MSRTLDAFIDAWKNRKSLGDDNKKRQLSAFLPAALEIQETPPSPLARWLSRTIIILLVIGIAWALLGKVNIVASAQGKILPSSRTKIIQPLQKGVVKSILVKEGERVVQGQPLIELDSTLTAADVNRLSQEKENTRMKLGVNQALLERLQSEQTREEGGNKAQDEASNAKSDKDSLTDPDYERLLQAQWRQYLARKQTLISAVEAAEAEIAGTKIEVQKLQKTLPIVTQRVKITKGLYEKKYASETEYLQL